MATIYFTNEYSGAHADSRGLLARALSRYTGNELSEENLGAALKTVGEYGKPALEGGPEFSVSHSRNTWAVLIAGSECGLDVQYRRNQSRDVLKQIVRRWYAGEDAALVPGTAGDEEFEDAFYRIWSRREALVKAAASSVADSSAPAVSGSGVCYADREWEIRDIEIPGAGGIYAAICMPAGEMPEEISIESI